MSTIYLGESGDLGFSFNRNSSKYFVIALFETSLIEKDYILSLFLSNWAKEETHN